METKIITVTKRYTIQELENLLYKAANILNDRDKNKLFGHKVQIWPEDVSYILGKIEEK